MTRSDNGAVGRPEQELLVRIANVEISDQDRARVDRLLDDELDWNYVVVLAAQHKVLQLVWHNLVAEGWTKQAIATSGLTEMWALYLWQLYTMNHERNKLYLGALEELAEAFEARGLTVLALKGGALIGTLYAPQARLVNDLDFLSSREQSRAVREAVESLGYRFGVYDYSRHELRPLERRVERAWLFHNHTLPTFYRLSDTPFLPYFKVQVGFDFFDPFEEFSADTGPILARARQKHPSSRTLIPSPEDMLINLCAHIFREGVSMVYDDYNINWQLTKMCDLRAFLRRNEDALDRPVFARHVDSMGLRPPMYFAFHYCRELYGDAMFDPWLELVDPGVEKGFLTELRDGKRRAMVDGAFLERFFSVRGPRRELRGGWSRQFEKFEWSAT
jgi:Uncharacterised nucleotidyltransferase